MDLAALQAFVIVAETGSFSLAAQTLYLSQPAVSKRVAVLESELATRLFDRIGRRVTLTEAGKVLLPRARRIIVELLDSKRAVANLAGSVSGRLGLGTSHHIALHRLPPVLRAFSRDYPAVDLDLRFMDSELVCHGVLQGDLEMGVVTLPLVPQENLVVQPLWDDPMSIVVGRGHALAQQAAVSLAELARFPAILTPRGTYTRDLLMQGFAALGVEPAVRMESHYLETIRMMVQVGLAWSVLPDTLIDEQDLVVLTVPPLRFRRRLGIVRHQARTLSNAARAMSEVLQAGQPPA